MKTSVNRFNCYVTVFGSINVHLLIIRRRKRKRRLKVNDTEDQYCERTVNTNDSVTYLLCSFYSPCERGDTSLIHVNKRQLEKTKSLLFNNIYREIAIHRSSKKQPHIFKCYFYRK